ncbi:hypothetical protein JL722_11642 [Aureococcus anophagefferens]|nr:hypothetical protein JL722_11642 [Aureococcus anophagefferens]
MKPKAPNRRCGNGGLSRRLIARKLTHASMANATVCLHYKEGDVSASFKLVLSPALQAKHATGKLLAWFARAERGTRPGARTA